MAMISNNSSSPRIIFAIFCIVGWTYLYISNSNLSSLFLFEGLNSSKVVILMRTPYFGRRNWDALSIMAINNRSYPDCFRECEITYDRERLMEAHALVFHAWPTDLIKSDLPKQRKVDQLWVWLEQESPILARKDLDSFSGIFNWTMTYRQDSDVFHPYSKIVPLDYEATNIASIETNESKLKNFLSGKRKLVAGVISKCLTDSKREVLIDQLAKHNIQVDIYGKCGIEICPHGKPKLGAPSCSESEFWKKLAQDYKFYLAFENAICLDYVTEKLFRTLELGLVPVVYGGANYTQIAPPNSFINVENFKSTKELASFLRNLDENSDEYKKYFEWRNIYKVVRGDGWCTLCEKVRKHNMEWESEERKGSGSPVWKTYQHLKDWWFNYPVSSWKENSEGKKSCKKPRKFS